MKTMTVIVAILVLLRSNAAIAEEKTTLPLSAPNPAPIVKRQTTDTNTKEDVPFNAYGSWNALQALATLVAQFETQRGTHNIHFMPYDSNRIIGFLDRHECDVGIAFDSSLPQADDKAAKQYEAFPLGRFVLAVAVNSKSRLRTISIDDLRKVFGVNLMTGPASWKDVARSGSTMNIELYRPAKFGPDGSFFQRVMLGGYPFSDEAFDRDNRAQHEKKSDAEIIAAIAKQANAIGFFRYSLNRKQDKRIRILGIAKDDQSEPVFPSVSNLAEGIGAYPLADTLTIYLHPNAPPEGKEFCAYVTGDAGAQILKNCGFWPEHELKEIRAKQHLAEAKRGKGELIAAFDLTTRAQLLKNLGSEFVKVKSAIQLSIETEENGDAPSMALTSEEAQQTLQSSRSDLLVVMTIDERKLEDKKLPRTPTLARKPKKTTKSGNGEVVSNAIPARSIVLGRMAVGVIVHSENPLESLPIEEVRAIFCGEIKKWPAVRGVAANMHAFGLKNTQPCTQLLKEQLAARVALKFSAQPDNEQVILAVARDPGAIGFVDLSQMSEDQRVVKLIALIMPDKTRSSPILGSLPDNYPLSQPCMLYLSATASETSKDFFEWLVTNPSTEVLLKHRLLPPNREASPSEAAAPEMTFAEQDRAPGLGLDLAPEEAVEKTADEQPQEVASLAALEEAPPQDIPSTDEFQQSESPSPETIVHERTPPKPEILSRAAVAPFKPKVRVQQTREPAKVAATKRNTKAAPLALSTPQEFGVISLVITVMIAVLVGNVWYFKFRHPQRRRHRVALDSADNKHHTVAGNRHSSRKAISHKTK